MTAAALASCAPITAEESSKDREYYEAKYADEAAPSDEVRTLLDFLDTCVGGQYIYSGQGDMITTEFVRMRSTISSRTILPKGRLEYFTEIRGEQRTGRLGFSG